jgi:predicted metal-binding membrane protein
MAGVAILAAAGFFQFAPAKARALAHCRMWMSHGHVKERGETVGRGLASGVVDGTYCVGCCWAFMAVFVAVGVMNLVAMVALAGVIFSEKLLPQRSAVLFGRVIGLAFLILAVAAAFRPSLLPGLHTSGTGMGGIGVGGM